MSNDKKEYKITVRVTEEENKVLDYNAFKAKMSKSELLKRRGMDEVVERKDRIADCLRKVCTLHKNMALVPIEGMRKVLDEELSELWQALRSLG